MSEQKRKKATTEFYPKFRLGVGQRFEGVLVGVHGFTYKEEEEQTEHYDFCFTAPAELEVRKDGEWETREIGIGALMTLAGSGVLDRAFKSVQEKEGRMTGFQYWIERGEDKPSKNWPQPMKLYSVEYAEPAK